MIKTKNTDIISIQKLFTAFGTETVHENINLEINSGKITAIIGGSGSGKTTLLREMLGLLKPVSGIIRIFGENILTLPPEKLSLIQRRFGVLFQQSALFSSLNVLENIIFPLKQFTKLNTDTMIELALLKLSLAGLSADIMYRYPAELSGGMQKRAALARALILDPVLLFLDEPSSGLDPVSAKSQDTLLLTLQRALNLTVVLVTHDVNTLENITDEIIFLGDKQVLAIDTFQKLKQNPHADIQLYFQDVRTHAKEGGSSWKAG